MASEKEIEARKARLRARGVPERFVDAIARRRASDEAAFVIISCLLVAGIVYLILLVQYEVMSFLAQHIYPTAQAALLAHTPEALGLFARLPMLFVMPAVPILWIWKAHVRRKVLPFPAYDPFASYLRSTEAEEPPDWAPEKLAHLPDDTAFLTAMREPWKPTTLPVKALYVVLAIASLMFVAALPIWRICNEIGIYHTVTLESVQAYGSDAAGNYPLDHTNYVFIECQDGKIPKIRYVLVTPPNGFNIWAERDPVHNLDADQVVARINQIDKRLRSLDVMIMTLSRTGPNGPAAIACVDKWAKGAHVKNKAAVERLIFSD